MIISSLINSILLENKISNRYLLSKKKDGFASVISIFSFLGITLGVATLIVTMAVMNGVKMELLNRIIGVNSHISIFSQEGSFDNYEETVKKIEAIHGVASVNVAVIGQGLASANGVNRGVSVRGISQDKFKQRDILGSSIVAGNIYQQDDFSLLIGTHLARAMGLRQGSTLSLITPNFSQSFFGNIPALKDFTVSGVFDVGMYEYDSAVVYTSLDSARKIFRLGKKINSIEVIVNNPQNLSNIKLQIMSALPENMYITDWADANSGFLESIDVQSNVLFLILALIILVAAFNIISGMVMLVNDKAKEVAILRTIGFNRASIMRIFVFIGLKIGVTGTFLGFLIGLGFASNIDEIRLWLESISDTNLFSAEIYFLSKLPAVVRVQDVLNSVILSLLLSFASTIYPALKAANLEPAEALKYE